MTSPSYFKSNRNIIQSYYTHTRYIRCMYCIIHTALLIQSGQSYFAVIATTDIAVRSIAIRSVMHEKGEMLVKIHFCRSSFVAVYIYLPNITQFHLTSCRHSAFIFGHKHTYTTLHHDLVWALMRIWILSNSHSRYTLWFRPEYDIRLYPFYLHQPIEESLSLTPSYSGHIRPLVASGNYTFNT